MSLETPDDGSSKTKLALVVQSLESCFSQTPAPGEAKHAEPEPSGSLHSPSALHPFKQETLNQLSNLLCSSTDDIRELTVERVSVILNNTNVQKKPLHGDDLVETFISCIHKAKDNSEGISLLRLITSVGLSCRLIYSIPSIFDLYHWAKQNPFVADLQQEGAERRGDFATSVLEVMNSICRLRSPHCYFSFNNSTPIFPLIPEISWNDKGYSWCAWVRLLGHSENPTNLVSFLSEAGSGIQMHFMPQGTSDIKIRARSMPDGEDAFFDLLEYKFSLDRWIFLAFSHTSARGSNGRITIFVDNETPHSYDLVYPYLSKSVTCTIGGFKGNMTGFYLFKEPLNRDKVAAIYASGPNFVSPMDEKFFGTSASFPRLPESLVKHTNYESSKIEIQTYFGLSASNSSDEYCLPVAWDVRPDDINCEDFHAKKIKGMVVCHHPNNKASFLTIGGLPYIFHMCSPQYQGPKFTNDRQVVCIINIITELIWFNPSIQKSLSETLGIEALRFLILEHVKPPLRTVNLLNACRQLLFALQPLGHDLLMDGFFALLLDYKFWGRADISVQRCVFQTINKSLRKGIRIFAEHIPITHLLDWIRFIYSDSFNAPIVDSPKPLNDFSIAKSILSWVPAFVQVVGFPIEHYRAYVFAIRDCTSEDLQGILLHVFVDICSRLEDEIYKHMFLNFGDCKVFLDLLFKTTESIRCLGFKVLAKLLERLPVPHSPERRQFADGLSYRIGEHLSVTEVTDSVYLTILDCILKQNKWEKSSEVFVGDSQILSNISMMEALFLLVSRTKTPIRSRIVMDFLTLLKTSDVNKKKFASRPLWQNMLIHLFSGLEDDDCVAINQIVSQMIQTTMWYSLCEDSDGWKQFYQTYWVLRRAMYSIPPQRPGDWRGFYEVMTNICSGLLSHLLQKVGPYVEQNRRSGFRFLDDGRSPRSGGHLGSIEDSPKLYNNLIQSFKLIELIAFSHPKSFLYKESDRKGRERSQSEGLPTSLSPDDTDPPIHVEVTPPSRSPQSPELLQSPQSQTARDLPPRSDTQTSYNRAMDSLPRTLQGVSESDLKEVDRLTSILENITSPVLGEVVDETSNSGDIDEENQKEPEVTDPYDSAPDLEDGEEEDQLPSLEILPPPPVRLLPPGSNDFIRSPPSVTGRKSPYSLEDHRSQSLPPRINSKIRSPNTEPTARSQTPAERPTERTSTPTDDQIPEPRKPLEAELEVLQKLLQCYMNYISFSSRRQDVLRIVLVYLREIFPHPDCAELIPLICSVVRCVFKDRLYDRTPTDYRTVRVAITFIKDAAVKFHVRGATEGMDIANNLIIELFNHWGPRLLIKDYDDDLLNQMNQSLETGSIVHEQFSLEAILQLIENTDDQARAHDVLDSHQKDFKFKTKQTYIHMNDFFRTVQLDDRRSREKRERGFVLHLQHYITEADTKATEQLYYIANLPTFFSKRKREYLEHINPFILAFQEDLATRVPEPDETLYWMLDEIECDARMRRIFRRNFCGTNHPEAVVMKGEHKRGGSETFLPEIAESSLITSEEDEDEDDGKENVSAESAEGKEGELLVDAEAVEVDSNGGDDLYDDGVMDDVPMTANKDIDMGKPLLTAPCTMITPLQKILGNFSMSESHLGFSGRHYIDSVNDVMDMPSSNPNLRHAVKSAVTSPKARDDAVDSEARKREKTEGRVGIPFSTCWLLRKIKMVLPRRYLLRENGIEVFAYDNNNHFFTFESKSVRNQVYKMVCKRRGLQQELSDKQRLKKSGIIKQWQKREISNFEYLMTLNTLAGRSFNDITQYHVFPWIIKDYTSETLDLSDPSIYRDLSKPMGALNEDRLEAFKERFEETSRDPQFPAFHYGSHYSSAGTALHYLLRLEPFCALAIHLQGGKFDLADRLFHSMDTAWEMSYTNVADVKELIPEFFYLPEFLYNSNNLKLGVKQDGVNVSNVKLPPWAKTPEDFVRINREALESDYVSEHLHEWIDLIFGYKQRGAEAVAAYNVFFHLTYAGSVDIDAIEDPSLKAATESQIYHFGQTPSQLLTTPHPQRFSKKDCGVSCITLPYEMPHDYRHSLVNGYGEERQPVYLCILNTSETVYVVDKRMHFHMTSVYQEMPFMKPAAPLPETIPLLCEHWKFSPEECNCILFTRNGKFCLSGGYRDNSVKAHRMPDGMAVASMRGHNDVVTALDIDDTFERYCLVTGARDGTVVLWKKIPKRHEWKQSAFQSIPSALRTIHRGSVVSVAINVKAGIIVSVATDFSVALYSYRRAVFSRKIEIVLKEPELKKDENSSGRLDSDLEEPNEPSGSEVGLEFDPLNESPTEEDDQIPSVEKELESVPKTVLIHDSGYIVLYVVYKDVPQLHLFSLNGNHLCTKYLTEHLSVLKCTTTGGFLVTGGSDCQVVFRHCHNFEVVQTFVCPPEHPITSPTNISPSDLSVMIPGELLDVTRNESSENPSPDPNTNLSPISELDALEPSGSDHISPGGDGEPDTAKQQADVESPSPPGELDFLSPQSPRGVVTISKLPDTQPTSETDSKPNDGQHDDQKEFDSLLPSPPSPPPNYPYTIVDIDIAPNEQFLTVALSDGRLIMLPLPNSANLSFFQTYATFAANTVAAVADSLLSTFDDTKEIAKGAVSYARDAVGGSQKLDFVRNKFWGAVSTINPFKRSKPPKRHTFPTRRGAKNNQQIIISDEKQDFPDPSGVFPQINNNDGPGRANADLDSQQTLDGGGLDGDSVHSGNRDVARMRLRTRSSSDGDVPSQINGEEGVDSSSASQGASSPHGLSKISRTISTPSRKPVVTQSDVDRKRVG